MRTRLFTIVAFLVFFLAACTITRVDTTNPTVALTTNQATVTTAGPLNLTADANDDTAITLVEFFQQPATPLRTAQDTPGTKIGEATEPPYEVTIDLSETDNGDQRFTAIARDAAGNQGSDAVTVTVDIPAIPTNAAPAFTSTPITGASAGDAYSYSVTSSDPDAGDTLTITASTKPDWLTLTDGGAGTATLEGTPLQSDVGTHDVTLRVSDAAGAADTQAFTITVSDSNDPPAFTSTPIESANEDDTYTYDITTSDPNAGDTLTITAPVKPDWLTLTDDGDGTATLAGTPSNDEVGIHQVELRVTDAVGAAATQAFTLTVVNSNDPPQAQDDAFTTPEDTTLNGDVLADNANGADTDPDAGDTLIVNTTPTVGPSDGVLTLNSDGTFEYVPNQDFDGADEFTYELRDTSAETDTATVSITITPINDPPTITTPPDESVIRNTLTPNTVTANFTIDDVETDPGALTVTATSDKQTVVADATLNPDCAAGACTLEFTPDASSDALVTITLTVDDGTTDASTTFVVNVTARSVLNTDDSGAGSLRDTLAGAVAGDVVGFDVGLSLNQLGPAVIMLTSGELLLDRDVTIEGLGQDGLSISGGGASRVMRVEAGVSALVSGVTITDGVAGAASECGGLACGGGVLNGGTLTIASSILDSNTATGGGGIYNLGTLTLTTSTLTNNQADSGGGIDNDGGTVTIQNGSAIDSNTATNVGGGILNSGTGTVTIDSSSISSNTTAGNGGGVFNNGSAVFIVQNNSAITGNQADGGGGIFNFGGTLTVDSSSITNNTATDRGGGIHHFAFGVGPVTIQNNSAITGNQADIGGGIYNETTVTIDSSSITSNTATDSGGGIYNFSGTMTVQDSAITGNTATNDGGGIYNFLGTVTIQNNSSLTGNQADGGGGIYNETTVTIDSSTLSGNSATGDGGGVHNTGGLTLSGNTAIEGNTGVFGGGVFNGSAGSLTMEDTSSIVFNIATSDGGGIYNDGGTRNGAVAGGNVNGNKPNDIVDAP